MPPGRPERRFRIRLWFETVVTFPPVKDLVPHRGPMCLLDRVLDKQGDTLTAEVSVGPQTSFVREDGVDVVVGIEYMAQAVAAWVSLDDADSGCPQKPRSGYLVAVRRADFRKIPLVLGTS